MHNIFKISEKEQVKLHDIVLNDIEKNIFTIVNNTVKYIRETRNINVTPRLAGGAVRDHLLGVEVDDIDIVVDNLSGLDFARLIKEYGKKNNIANIGDVYEVSLEKTSDEKIKDEQVETLKVGGINIFGQKVEFIGLRTEIYDPFSRKPKIAPTNNIKEDVLRRDLTINSMYYNILTGEVEDYVGGMEDLRNMYLRTPLEPIKTFVDDPLRMLRVLRFYSKFKGSTIDPKIIEVMKQSNDPSSQFSVSYKQKIHPNRASKELKKMFSGENPIDSAKLLLGTGFYKLVFKIPEDWHNIDMDQQSPYHNMTLLNHTLKTMENINSFSKNIDIPKDEKSLLLISSMLHDFGKMSPQIKKTKIDKKTGLPITFYRGNESIEQHNYIGHELESANFVDSILKEMAFEPEEKKFIHSIVSNHMFYHNNLTDKSLGKFLNKADKYWKYINLHAKADALSKEDISDDEIKKIEQEYDNKKVKTENYSKELGDKINKTLLDGIEIDNIVKETIPEISEKKAYIKIKDNQKPIFYIKYLMNKLTEAQWSKKVKDKEQAIDFIKKEIKNFYSLWKNQQGNNDKNDNINNMNNNVNKNTKTALKGYNTLDRYYEDPPDLEKRVSLYALVPYKEGDKVRLRANHGVNMTMMPLVEGRVIKITDTILFVKWESGKVKGKNMKDVITSFNLNDPLKIAIDLEKI